MIQDLQKELDNMGSQEDVTPKIEAVNSELRSIQAEKSRLDGERQDLRRDKDEATGELRRKIYCKHKSYCTTPATVTHHRCSVLDCKSV